MKKLIQDMTDAEITAEINKLTRKAMSAHQVFRYRSLTEAISLRQRAALASAK